MILTVTPNPAFDRIQTIPNFQLGKVCRATSLTLSPGGKGVNVARAIHNLGGQALCTGFLGGHTGRMQADFMAREGIQAQWTWIDGETRVSVVAVASETGETTVLNEEGPTVTPEDWGRMQAEVVRLAEKVRTICISGSLPLGLNPDLMGEMVTALNRGRRSVWIDSSGASLRSAMGARPGVIKVNNLEAAALLNWREFDDIATAAQAAQTIQHNGISKVILTLGKNGAVLASDAGAWLAKPPSLKIVCPIGSGDAFFAGLVMSAQGDLPDPEALRCAVAAGTANALSVGGGKFTRQEFDQVLAGVTVKKLA